MVEIIIKIKSSPIIKTMLFTPKNAPKKSVMPLYKEKVRVLVGVLLQKCND